MPAQISQCRGQGAIARCSGSLELMSITHAPRQGSCSSLSPQTEAVSSPLPAPKGGKTFRTSLVGSRMRVWEGNQSLSLCSALDPPTAAQTRCAELLCPKLWPCWAGLSVPVPPTSTAREMWGEKGPESTSSRPHCHPLCSWAASPQGAPQAPGRSQDRAGPLPPSSVLQLLSILQLNSPNPAGGAQRNLFPG